MGRFRFPSLRVQAQAWMPAGARGKLSALSAGTAGARVSLPRSTASRAKSWSMITWSCQAISCLSSVKLGDRSPSGGRGGLSELGAARGTAPALSQNGRGAGWRCARSPTKCGPPGGPNAKATVDFFRRGPAGAGHGNPSPVRSAARQARESVQMTLPLPSSRMRAGMVVTPNISTKAFPRGPAAASCGIAFHLGIL